MTNERIVSIIPASPGWLAVFGCEAGPTDQTPLACWALLENVRGDRRVVGMVASHGVIEPADYVGNFQSYSPTPVKLIIPG
ncbi:MAG: hypothetical protein HQL86_00165 [Magnetococcales bacterium]|nr:hypothetical protein [Magnetococcales bacterium]